MSKGERGKKNAPATKVGTETGRPRGSGPVPAAGAKGAGDVFAEQAEKARLWLEKTAALLRRNPERKSRQTAAFALWVGYPFLLELIGRNVKVHGRIPDRVNLSISDASWRAYYALNAAHQAATSLLMAEAEKRGLDRTRSLSAAI